MPATVYVGRVGGLAVALGIGMALWSGQAVASADPTDSSPGSSSATAPAGPSTSSDATHPHSGSSRSAATPRTRVHDTPSNDVTQDDSRNAARRLSHSRKADSRRSPYSRVGSHDAPATLNGPSAEPPEHSAVTGEPDKPTNLAATSAPRLPQRRLSAPLRDTRPAVPADSPRHTTIAMAVAAHPLRPSAGDDPAWPAAAPAMWTLLGAARRETLDEPLVLRVVGMPTTTPTTAVAAGVGVPGTATEQNSPLAWLQRVPFLGPVFVTPIVEIIHRIPIVSDIVHPYVGYPIQRRQPADVAVSRDVKVTSFDNALIYTHFMPAKGLLENEQAPTILFGPGLIEPGGTNLNGTFVDPILADLVGQVSIGQLRAAGYNVVTWDPRGEWRSGGILELNSPDYEARDVSAIISWLATQPEVELDDRLALDPRIGMVGVSYGGGIQLVAAATDHRIDAIVPTITYNSLLTSLDKNQAFKSGWGPLLSAGLGLIAARVDPRLYPASIYGLLTGQVSQSDQDILAASSPGGPLDLIGQITAPTLLIQGTVDTIFSLQESDSTAKELIAAEVPTKVLWFCGGHGICLNNLFDLRDGQLIQKRTLEWLNTYVNEKEVDTGPQFEWVDQRGQWFSSEAYPVKAGSALVAGGTGGRLRLIPYLRGSGLPLVPIAFEAHNAIELTVSPGATTEHLVGAPQLSFTYSGTGSSRHVYAQLVDDTTGLVLGNIVTPIEVTLDGAQHVANVSLEPIAATLNTGQTVTLQIVSFAGLYGRLAPSVGAVDISDIRLVLPTAAGAHAEAT